MRVPTVVLFRDAEEVDDAAADGVGGRRRDDDIVLRGVVLARVVLGAVVDRLGVGRALVVGLFAVIRFGFVVVATAADQG